MDIDGNSALHYAVAAQNMDMAAKLLSYKANIEARNKDELTPLLLAVTEKKQQMVEFLVKRNANVHAVDKMKRTSLMLAVNDSTSDIVRLLLQQGVDVFSQDNCGWIAEEHAFKRGLNLYRFARISKRSIEKNKFNNSCLIKPDVDDSWPESDDDDFCFETKNVVNPSVAKIMSVVQQALKNIEEKYGTLRNVKETSSEDDQAHRENEDGSATLPKPSTAVQEEETKPATGNEENGINIIESAPQKQTNNDILICADGTHENDTNALGLGKKEDEESPWDSESFAASVPGNYIVYLPEAAEESGKNIPNGQVEDSSDWDSTGLPSNHETRQRTGDLKVDDKCPFVSQSMTPNQSASTDFGHMTLEDKETTNIGAVFLIGSPRLHNLRESRLPEKGESKEDFSAELVLGLASEEKQERLRGSEKNHPWVIEERNDSQRQLSQELNARMSQDTIPTNHLCKQKIEINLKEMNSEVQEASNEHVKAIKCAEKMQDQMQKLETECAELKDTIKKQASRSEQLQRNLLGTSLSENE
ncbi:ankyrin repeat domain-containing protein 26-like [Pteropus medius]|uniref:ankyrin repeat domain-containing protein 26-like n=1 Tax=Pteropus vampyrus TaxID=132908 RepID=UPI00196BA502|nr:ankyrin repeat domain-containing protein 26-like [Pteropus giganteus]